MRSIEQSKQLTELSNTRNKKLPMTLSSTLAFVVCWEIDFSIVAIPATGTIKLTKDFYTIEICNDSELKNHKLTLVDHDDMTQNKTVSLHRDLVRGEKSFESLKQLISKK